MPSLIPLNPTDYAFLRHAFGLAHASGTPTAPNPRVGCVIVSSTGTIIAEGVSRPAGGPHAEVVALHAAGNAAAGSSVYVTLEPCDHYGRTPACSKQLVQAKVARVIYGLADPNPLASGGATTLDANQIAVSGPLDPTDPLFVALRHDLAGFITVATTGRPHVTLKLAQQANGNTKPTNTRYLTGVNARRSVHRMRLMADAVLVGSGTVIADDPKLTVRDRGTGLWPPSRTNFQPKAVVLDRRLQSPPNAAVFRENTLLVTTAGHAKARLDAYRSRGVKVSELPTGTTDRESVLQALCAVATAGVNDVFAEPGMTLAHALIDANAVDRLVLHVTALPTGEMFTPCIPLAGFHLVSTGRFDRNDCQFTFVSKRKHP